MHSEIIVIPVVVGIPAAVMAFRLWLRHRERMADLTRVQRAPESDARLERLEQAVESIALEMERVGEGQRFLTKVLVERVPDAAREAPKLARTITPH